MTVYFAQAGTSGPVKIGWSKNVLGRLISIQGCNYEKIRLLRHIDGDQKAENILHRYFRVKGLHISGEWFLFDPDMLTIEISEAARAVKGTPRSYPKPDYKTDLFMTVRSFDSAPKMPGFGRPQLSIEDGKREEIIRLFPLEEWTMEKLAELGDISVMTLRRRMKQWTGTRVKSEAKALADEGKWPPKRKLR